MSFISDISTNGNSSLNFALYKNKKLYELYSFCNYFEPNLKSEIVYSNDNKSATAINKLSYLDEYIQNYRAFNCKYFLLEKIKK